MGIEKLKVKIFTASSRDPLNSGDVITSKIETWISDELRDYNEISIKSVKTSSNDYTIVTTVTYKVKKLVGRPT